MRTNLFKVRELDKEKIIVEEEQLKHPFIFFLKRHSDILLLLLLILGVSSIGIGLGITISLVGNTGDFDISYISGSSQIDAIPDLDDEEAEKELLGDIAVKDGVVLITEKFMTENGDIVTYYSDGTSLIVTSKGVIKRVVALDDGSYAIDRFGKIDKSAIRKIVTAQTSTLEDGTIITYYSDGTAEITKNKITTFIRDSSNIVFDSNSTVQIIDNVKPSGVTYTRRNIKYDNYSYIEFFDGSVLINDNDKTYVVHNLDDVILNSDSYSFPNNNMSTIKETKKLSDGNTIDYFNDGSAIITDKNNEKLLVRKSGDIIIKDDKIFEIYPNKRADAVSTINSPDGKKITYYDNGAAVVEKNDGTKEYVEDSSKIKYDGNKNIKTITSEKLDETKSGRTPDGTKVTNFPNGKSQVIEPNGDNYIVDTDTLTFDIIGNIVIPSDKTSKTTNKSSTQSSTKTSRTRSQTSKSSTQRSSTVTSDSIEDGDLLMSDGENEYNYSKSKETTKFIITNKSRRARRYRLVLEETSNYEQYEETAITKFSPEGDHYVRLQATVGSTIIPATALNNIKIDIASSQNNNYLIYEGKLGAQASTAVTVILYIDYEPLDNKFQDKTFRGTIRLYYVSDDE